MYVTRPRGAPGAPRGLTALCEALAAGTISPPLALAELARGLRGGDGGAMRSAGAEAGAAAGAQPASDPAGGPADAPPGARERPRRPPSLAELDALVGLDRVKALVREMLAFAAVQERRRAAGLKAEPVVLHMVFSGNPGTGKTTVARILGAVLREADLLPRGHVVEVERADLVGEYIGHTAQKTREQVRAAQGGILFVDEAYSLARGGERDFGKEAIDTLVKAMEDKKHDLVVILAGYRDEMQAFISVNPGLRSRFPIHIDFPDYTPDELLAIAEVMLGARDYRLAPAARTALAAALRAAGWGSRAPPVGPPGNARTVRNLVEAAIRRQALRLADRPGCGREDLVLMEAADLDVEGVTAATQPAAGAGTAPRGEVPPEVAFALRQLWDTATGAVRH